MKNKSKWFHSINSSGDNSYSELEHEISENPTDEELDKIAQELLRERGFTDKDDFVSIGKGKLLTIEELGGCMGVEIIETIESTAGDEYDIEEPLFSAARKEDFEDLDRRIAQTLKEWAAERDVMSTYYTIPDTKEFYYRGDNEDVNNEV